MKERFGFVSNSSSSSFCVYGAYVGEPNGVEFFKLLREDFPEQFKNAIDYLGENGHMEAELLKNLDNLNELGEEKLSDLVSDSLYEYMEDIGFEQHSPNRCCVGVSYDDMRDDETKKQFRERIESTLKRIFGGDIDVGHIEETYWSQK